METVGTEPVVYYRKYARRAGAVLSGKRNAGARSRLHMHIKTKITSTGGYDAFNVPFLPVTEYGDSRSTASAFSYDGQRMPSELLNIRHEPHGAAAGHQLGPRHANMVEPGVNVHRQCLCVDLRASEWSVVNWAT
jgi:hypothetical protein